MWILRRGQASRRSVTSTNNNKTELQSTKWGGGRGLKQPFILTRCRTLGHRCYICTLHDWLLFTCGEMNGGVWSLWERNGASTTVSWLLKQLQPHPTTRPLQSPPSTQTAAFVSLLIQLFIFPLQQWAQKLKEASTDASLAHNCVHIKKKLIKETEPKPFKCTCRWSSRSASY